MSARHLIGRRARLTIPPERLPRSLAARLTPAQRQAGPAGVIIGTEGSGDGQEIMLLLDGLDRAMFVKRRAVQLLRTGDGRTGPAAPAGARSSGSRPNSGEESRSGRFRGGLLESTAWAFTGVVPMLPSVYDRAP